MQLDSWFNLLLLVISSHVDLPTIMYFIEHIVLGAIYNGYYQM